MKQKLNVITLILLGMAAFPLLAYEDYGNNTLAWQFSQLDSDQNGYISKAEIEARPRLTRHMQVYEYGNFELGDVNSDGVLSLDEFMAEEEVLPAE